MIRWSLRRLVIACLVCAAATGLVAGESSARGRNRNDSGAKPLPRCEKLCFGLHMGTTVTPDRWTGFVGANESYTQYHQGPVVRTYQVQYSSRSPVRPLLGASAEIKLTGKLSIKAMLSYRRDGGSLQVFDFDGYTSMWSHREYKTGPSDTLEIPVLLKYRFMNSAVTPFIGVGPAFRVWELDNLNGVASTVGFDVIWRQRWVVTPQVNYVRWEVAKLGYRSWTSKNQVQAMIGFTF